MIPQRFSAPTFGPRRTCGLCHKVISSSEAIAALAVEETSKVLVHVSCLTMGSLAPERSAAATIKSS
jgi:hypothetical protein